MKNKAKKLTPLQVAREKIRHLEDALGNAIGDSAAHAATVREQCATIKDLMEKVAALKAPRAQPSFPNNPTWQQKFEAVQKEHAKLEEERLVTARQIHDFNVRLGINDTNERRIEELQQRIQGMCKTQREQIDALNKEHDTEVERLEAELSEANAREPETEPEVATCTDVVDALTDVIRHAKKIRREWRGEV